MTLPLCSAIDSSLFLDTDGGIRTCCAGKFNLGNINIFGNTVSATNTNGNVNLTANGTGVVAITGTGAIQIPAGTTAQQPQAGFRQVGMVRYNTDLQYVEVWNGSVWQDASGSGGVSYQTAEEIGIVSALIFG